MNVAMVHHHLNHSGVTQVIANQLRALDRVCSRADDVRVAVLSDGQTAGWPTDLPAALQSVPLTMCRVPGLAYDELPQERAALLAAELDAQLAALGWAPHETLLHVHNHGLGKNASLPGALRQLAEKGFALLLQIHDFAEDCRPRNYRHLMQAWNRADVAPVLYPQAAQIHYAVLNRRDDDLLAHAGVPRERLHFLPNPLPDHAARVDRHEARGQLHARFGVPPAARFLLYPVRAIRRKNLGETLLWSALAGPETHVGVTLAPLNPAEQDSYRRWKQLARELPLNVHFEIGGAGGLPLATNLVAADLILTTSVAEGFGMVFLESWLADRMLVGRDLPDVTSDFTLAGLRLEYMAGRIGIPVEVVGHAAFSDMLVTAWREMRRAYGRPAPDPLPSAVGRHARTDGETIDFGDLDEAQQVHVLRRVVADRALRRRVLELNGCLTRALALESDEQGRLVAHNQCVVRREYSLAPSGTRLRRIYQQVWASGRDTRAAPLPHAHRISEEFLALTRFRPIRG